MTMTKKEKLRKQIEQQIKEFKEKGGEIEHVEEGVTTAKRSDKVGHCFLDTSILYGNVWE